MAKRKSRMDVRYEETSSRKMKWKFISLEVVYEKPAE
jgi:hypothetical protein